MNESKRDFIKMPFKVSYGGTVLLKIKGKINENCLLKKSLLWYQKGNEFFFVKT